MRWEVVAEASEPQEERPQVERTERDERRDLALSWLTLRWI